MHRKYRRRGVSPVIAVLMLIAIAVATGIIVYVWVMGLSGSLTKSGGTQVSEQLELVAYDFSSTSNVTLHIRNTGGSKIILDRIYFDGNRVAIAKTSYSVYYKVTSLDDSTSYSAASTSPYYLSVIDGWTSGSTITGANIKADMTLDVGGTLILSISLKSSARSGSSHVIKIITADGAIFPFSVIAGRYS